MAGVFFAGAETVAVQGAVDGEDAVQVIHFVLQEFGKGAGGFDACDGVVVIRVAEVDRDGTFETDEEVGEGKAIVPKLEFFGALEFEFGIAKTVSATVDFDVY